MELRRTLGDDGWMKIHLALSDDEPDVSRLWAPTFDMRIGSAVVKMGGISGVGTDEEHRMRGYSRLVMEESTRYFTETGHDIAVLFGISDFYHKFGYAPALPVTTLTVKVQDALRAQPQKAKGNFIVRPLRDDDWSAVLELYDANNRTRTGTLLRPRATWQGYRHGTEWSCKTETFVVVSTSPNPSLVRRGTSQTPLLDKEEKGGVVGYVTFDDVDDACRVGDLGYETPAVFAVLLMTTVEQAQRRNVEEFEVKLPPNHPFVTFCHRCGGAVRTVYRRNGGGMARVIGLRSLCEKLTGLLTARLKSSWGNESMGQWDGKALELRTDIGRVVLEISDGEVQVADGVTPTWVVSLPQVRLTQLAMGYRSVSDVALDDDVHISPQVAPLLDALFPVGHPWMPIPDWF